MAKQKKPNPLDVAIQSRIAIYNQVEGFKQAATDPDLMSAFIFIATQMEGLQASCQLIIRGFVPAVNKMVSDTRGQLYTSIYKNTIKGQVENSLQVMIDDTIRLGYVMFFHKYETFVNEYISWVEEHNKDEESSQSLMEYSKIRFDFNPFQWWKFPTVHKVNFVSNCSKHHNGKCKVKDNKHTKPRKYLQTPESEIIKPTLQEFKDDTTKLIESVANNLIPIVSNIAVLRSSEGMIKSYESIMVTCENSALFHEKAMNETFSHEGVEYPLFVGDELLPHINKVEEYRNKIEEFKLELQKYKSRADVSLQIITSTIKQYHLDTIEN